MKTLFLLVQRCTHPVGPIVACIALAMLVGPLNLPGADPKAPPPIKHTEIPGMLNYSGVKYLPEDRYSGDLESRRGDFEMMLNLHVPKEGKGPFPIVIYVHGGAFSSGDKDGPDYLIKQCANEFAGRGIAFCSLNYIMLPKGIFPQVYWDFHDAVRYLRKNADKYNIDPLRIGQFGISAGGWLISSASMPDGNYWQTSHDNAITSAGLAKIGWHMKQWNTRDYYCDLLKPIQNPAPAWPGEAGGVSALSWDFSFHTQYGTDASPSIQQWTGLMETKPGDPGVRPAPRSPRITYTELISKKYAGRGVHAPSFFTMRDNDEAIARTLDGKGEKELGKVIADFFVRELMSPSARPPAPEIYPIPRIINAPTPVTMVVPRGAQIHCTTDGTDPTPASPVYKGPIIVTAGTTVKAITAAPGMEASGVASAEFIAGAPAATVTGPASLPPAETGKPYSVTFTTEKSKACWQLCGDMEQYPDGKTKATVYPNGMKLDPGTGIWSGTPTTPGNYWIQIWVGDAPHMIAGYRNYRWTVTGKAMGEGSAAPAAEAADRSQQFATLKAWPAEQSKALLEAFSAAKLRVLTPGKPGDAQLMLLVHADDRAKAEALLKEYLGKHPELGAGTTLEKP